MDTMSLRIIDTNNKKIGDMRVPEGVFNAPIKPHLIYEAVKYYQAKKRRGTASTKNRIEVRGGGRKPWRQKGTGRARAGSIRSPLWKGGGIIFGPTPRSFYYNLPAKVVKGALRTSLSLKLKEGKLRIIKDINLKDHKSKTFVALMSKLGITTSALIVNAEENRNLFLAARNVEGFRIIKNNQLNPYEIMKYDQLILTQKSTEKLSEVLA
jgi:large subunit ribosomal protein L4